MTCVRCSRELEVDSAFCRFCGAPIGRPDARHLNRLPADGKIAGVCAGIAAYFDTDVTLVRLAWVVLSMVPGVFIGGILAYVVAWLLMPAAAGGQAYAGKRLIRSMHDKKIAGVCGGVAEYIDIDATIVRVISVALAIYPGVVVLGVVAYIIAWLIIPAEQSAPLHPATTTA